eukprot:985938_1
MVFKAPTDLLDDILVRRDAIHASSDNPLAQSGLFGSPNVFIASVIFEIVSFERGIDSGRGTSTMWVGSGGGGASSPAEVGSGGGGASSPAEVNRLVDIASSSIFTYSHSSAVVFPEFEFP